MKKITLLFVVFLVASPFIYAQETSDILAVDGTNKPLTEQFVLRDREGGRDKSWKKQQRNGEHKIDKQSGGIGMSVYDPMLGSNIESGLWTEANLLTDLLEFRLGFGQFTVNGYAKKQEAKYNSARLNEEVFGYNFYVGANLPIKYLAFGRQASAFRVFRGHPVVTVGAGLMNFTNKNNYRKPSTAQLWYIGASPGYRVRFPAGSLEFNFNMSLGLRTGAEKDFYKTFNFYPSATLRLDALKLFYDPKSVTIHGTQTNTENYKSTSYRSGNYIYTYTTYDVVTRPVSFGIQDIGFHLGVGPKISYMSPKRSPYIPTSLIGGVAVEGRYSFLDFGFSLEGGKIGHGGKLVPKKSEKFPYRKKLDRNETTGLGTVNTLNFYSQIGIDLTSIIAGLAGISISKGSATSFFALTGGINVGGHFTWGQQFIDPNDATKYDQLVAQNDPIKVKEKFIDPRKVGLGYLGGFYLNVEIGALSFKITNLRYYAAPFASTTMYSITYRFPVVKRK